MSENLGPLVISADLKFSEDESEVSIFISTDDRSPLKAQSVVDAVVDMVMAHFGMSKEDWERMNDKDLDS